jgi:uncharacterized protein YaaW (UPF0174 family)
MPFEMQAVLGKCDVDDYRVLAQITASYIALTDDKEMDQVLSHLEEEQTDERKAAVTRRLEADIRYYGSSEAAHWTRRFTRDDQPAGVSAYEILDDISKRLKVRQRTLGTLEARLERLVRAVTEKTFFKLNPEQQRELFEKAGISKEQQRVIFDQVKENKVLFFPILYSVLGREVVAKLVEGLAIAVVGQFLGREAAKQLIRQLATKFPWWAEWLGPIVWALSLSWLAFDLQGPAYRKTVPAMLYLGIVSLRDGPEEPNFWEPDEPQDDQDDDN